VTNLAARLCGEAAGGEILLAPRVVAALDEGEFQVESAGEFVLKGFARPVAAARVRGQR
jgi:class 3 adenylate cyclase